MACGQARRGPGDCSFGVIPKPRSLDVPYPPTPGGKYGCSTGDPNSIPKFPWWFYSH
jgi:hypothetical protein